MKVVKKYKFPVISTWDVMWCSRSVVSDSVTPWTVACRVPLSMGFSRQEYWSGAPVPSPGDLPEPGTEPSSPALAGGFFTAEPSDNIPHDKYNYHCSMLHMEVFKGINPKNSHHEEKIFFSISLMLYLYEMMDVLL